MDLGRSEEQDQLVASFAALFAKGAAPEQVRAAEPGGFDADLWRTLLDTGGTAMGVPEAAGGWGASLLDLALVAEELGRAAAPAPLLEAQVAARLLAAAGAPAAARLEAVLAGEQLVTIALHPIRDVRAGLVPAGAIADAVIVAHEGRLVLVPVDDSHRTLVGNLASAPLADLDLDLAAAEPLADGPAAANLVERALDDWLVLTAAALVGLGDAAHRLGCAYATERRAFGVPIGTFQGIAHPLADDATRLDGARLLTHKAAWALDGGDPRGRELAAMAFAFAAGTAEQATYDALHVHGGYGFMMEYDVQLYFRRARGWARVWGDAAAGYRRAAAARYDRGAA